MKRAGIPVDYGLNANHRGQTLLLKLHGSVNWAKCSICPKIHAGPFDVQAAYLPLEKEGLIGTSSFQWTECCGQPLTRRAVIVPPTFDKSEYRKGITAVWARAAEVLSEATNIFVCGYSLPESDLFFRYLYSLGSIGAAVLERFWVFNPDPAVDARFSDLLGSGAKRRYRFEPLVFESGVSIISSLLKG
jgi:hypothetical protein